MIHIVTLENRHLFHHALADMHRQRRAVFVDQMRWPLDAPNGLEIDAFDAEDAVYLLSADTPRAPVKASLRLLPTVRPHLLSEVFAHLCAEAPPRAATIWEASRFCPAPETPKGEARRKLLGLMIAGILETGLLFGIEKVTFVASAALSPLAQAAGWRTRALGPPRRYERDRLTAFAADIDAEGLRQVRRRYALAAPLTRYAPADLKRAA